jgi:YD repeat-containing protein
LLDSLRVPDFNGQPDVIDVTMDGRGQLTEVTATYPTGPGTTAYGYNTNGNLTSITDPRNQVMSFTFDTLGRMLSYTDKLNKTKSWTYDEAGRETSMTNRNQQTLTRTWDTAGRLTTMVGPGVDRELRYDPLGRLVFAREGAHIVETRYDQTGAISQHVYATDTT